MPKKKVIPETEPEIDPENLPAAESGAGAQSGDGQVLDGQVQQEPAGENTGLPNGPVNEGDIPEILAVEAGVPEPEGDGGEMLVPEESTEKGLVQGNPDSLDGEDVGPSGESEFPASDGAGEAEHEGGDGDDEMTEHAIPQGGEPLPGRSVFQQARGAQPPGNAENTPPAVAVGETSQPAGSDRRTFYDLDFNALDRDLSPEQRQEWNSIYASYRGRSALTGTVVGIDRHTISTRDRSTGEMVRQEMYCAIVIPFRVRILIPASEMWPKEETRPDYVLRNMTGASIDFVIIHVDREAGFAIASRRLALNTRRYYFSTQPSMNRPGARVKCRVLAVGPRRCLVECYGYDINLTQREMRYSAIPDLRDEYHPGQELDCIVKEYDREGGKLTISVKETNPNPFDGAELRHPEGSRRQAVIAGKYAGGVFCNLPDGVVVMCSYSFHYDDSAFAIGDKVIVVIQRYDFGKKQIYGKIVAKW